MSSLVRIEMPSENQEGTTSIIGQWLKKPGEMLKLNEPVLEINTDKVTLEIPAPAAGVLQEILKQANEKVGPGELLGTIAPLAGDAVVNRPEEESIRDVPPSHGSQRARGGESRQSSLLSPAVKRLLKENGLTTAALENPALQGSGLGGRVTAPDLSRHLARPADSAKASARVRPSPGSTPAGHRTVPHSPTRRMIADHMVASLLHTAPHVTTVFQADFSTVLKHREQHRESFSRQGVRLTLSAYVVAAATKALLAVPEVNSRWHSEHLEIFADCNIGLATAVDGGPGRDVDLVVPVIAKAQKLDLLGIARSIQALTERARAHQLDPQDLRGGTFTISNHGVSGSIVATPIIINQPQSAILGIGKLEKRVLVVEERGRESIQIRPVAYVTLTIDHRVLDGFKANAFMSAFVEKLEGWDDAGEA